MGDFNIKLSGPQAQGADVLAPVRAAPEAPVDVSMFQGITETIGRAFANDKKQDAVARKKAVIAEYTKKEEAFTEALTTGQWTAAQVATASRANFTKMIAGYSEYLPELLEAKKAVYDGTEVGEAQKQLDREVALRESDKKNASDKGYSFYPNMSADAENKAIDAYKATRQLEVETEARHKANVEDRAQAGEERAVQTHENVLKDIKNKDDTVKGLLTVADKNFDSLTASIKDLSTNTSMTYEEKLFAHSNNVNRIKAGLAAVSATNPSLAAPWMELVNGMDALAQKMIDPKVKASGEAELLKNQFDAMMYKAKIAVVTDPELRKYVVASQLFNDPNAIILSGSPKIQGWLAGAASGDPAHQPAPMVGTTDEKPMLKTLKSALSKAQTSGDPKAIEEGVNAANVIMKQTSQTQGSISPSAMKDLSAFYSSAEFGKLAASGKVDKPSMQNVKQVFQVSYEPAVRQAIMQRLDDAITRMPSRGASMDLKPKQTLSDTVDIQFSGAGVKFVDKPGVQQTVGGTYSRRSLDEAAAGLNTLIHMGAHLEGTTDYGKYWEENKHLIMPGYYMKDVSVGTIKGDYKFLGGDARSPKSWELVKPNGG